MTAGDYQRWGVDITHKNFTCSESREYLRTGIILEQVLVKYFHMAIGTVGYEKHWDRLSLALVYESELTFDAELTNTSNVQIIIGMGM